MTATLQRQPQPTTSARQDTPPERLASSFTEGMRAMFADVSSRLANADAWRRIEADTAQYVGNLRGGRDDRSAGEMYWEFERLIAQAAPDTNCAPDYTAVVARLGNDTRAWPEAMPAHTAAHWRHAALTWLSLLHAANAGVEPAAAWRAVGRESPAGMMGVTPSLQRSAPTVAKDVMARDRQRETRQEAPLCVDGKALRKSVLPVWLLLIALSWVSLIWGALISAPLGLGVAIMTVGLIGLVAVPLWGTIFGFLGMNQARASTLAGMGFTRLDGSHDLNRTLSRFAEELGVPAPELGTMEGCNACAMGVSDKDATIAIGRPLMDQLTQEEVNAVLAHELGHVVSGDMRRMMLMRTFQNATVWYLFAQGLKQFARWVICWAAELAILAFSRRREYWADAVGAALGGKEAMISALRKLEEGPSLTSAERRHARFMFRGRAHGLLSTHPSFAQRIEALERETYLKRLPVRRGNA